MASFDPAAATAAYMAQLSPAAHAKATAYTQGGHWLLLWGWLVTVAACVLIARSRVLDRVRTGLQRRQPRPLLAALVVSILFMAFDWLLELPWSSYADWWRERQYGLTSQPWIGWLVDNALVFAVTLPLVGVFFVALYALVRRAPRTWPLWTGVVVGAFLVFGAWAQPAVVEPMVNHYAPAPPGPVRDLVVAMGKAYGVPTDRIFVYNGSKQSNRYTANVAGLFGSARVALSDTMFAQGADLAEVRGVVGHEMGHYVMHHVLWGSLFQAVMAVLAALGVRWLFPVVRGWVGARGVMGIDDPAGLPIVFLVFVTLSLLATPILNTWTRMQEAAADSFSLEHAHEPDGLARALVKTIAYRASSPSDLEAFLFYNHPSVEHRVRKAMDWKAAHPNEKPAP
ncbi:MAG TPA: M48 family metalloprotease [Caulobacteraceae bacterium]|jgi:STE24 endopeptidase|nr:M48 family metalloprotease [Caulobacteraceae bacterium]